MQQRLRAGYSGYLTAIRRQAAPTAVIAGVGQAWAWVHDNHPQLFRRLYQSDGSHPTTAGTYLAALVLARTLSHHRLPAKLWKPPELNNADAATVQTVARTA